MRIDTFFQNSLKRGDATLQNSVKRDERGDDTATVEALRWAFTLSIVGVPVCDLGREKLSPTTQAKGVLKYLHVIDTFLCRRIMETICVSTPKPV